MTLHCLPGEWSGACWSGQTSKLPNLAEQSAAVVALSSIRSIPELAALANAEPGPEKGMSKVAKLRMRERKGRAERKEVRATELGVSVAELEEQHATGERDRKMRN